jgi:hypothetical protein
MKGLKENRVRRICSAVGILSVAACLAGAMAFAQAQPTPTLIQQMVGTWSITERMWPAPDAAPMALPPATAERRLLGDALLHEVMKSLPGTKPPFTRISLLNYNAVTRQYEYTSWDTRAPQMMAEKGDVTGSSNATAKGSALSLYGG